MKIATVGVHVDDQQAALEFYTEKLGWQVTADFPAGEHRWITVAAPEDPTGPQLALEPSDHPAVGPYRAALVADGIPAMSFAVDDVQAEYERLVALGVEFTQAPLTMGPMTTAIFDDTQGNLLQIAAFDG